MRHDNYFRTTYRSATIDAPYSRSYRGTMIRSCLLLAFVMLPFLALGEDEYNPEIFGASSDAEVAIKNFQLPAGLKAELFAAEPRLANPVGLCVDLRGRVYILETFRAGLSDVDGATGATIDTDLPLRTVQDREDFLKKKWGAEVSKFARDHERLRLIEDTDGDGRADRDFVFMSSNGLTDGIGAGVLAYKNDVYWANVPRLWKLRDTDGDGKADVKDTLHHGYGVHGGIRGHDLHGLRIGPDGKLYFNIGDRGLNITTGNKTLESFDTGCILRCNLDGSELEIFARGLRNPHDLAFDEFGNLFTCDNDSGGGDKSRILYLVEGGDYGWRNGFQFINYPISRGVWNSEKLWHTAFKGQAAHVLPPIAHLTNGPAGLTYYPGTGLPDHFERRFFLADFRYSAADSGLHTFRMNPKGASFEFSGSEKSIWGILLTDADFGPDSQLYCSDWVAGGSMPKKGRVYRILDPERAKSAVVLETKKLLYEGMEGREPAELIKLLAHPNMMVRREAQFQLAAFGKTSISLLEARARAGDHQLARVHAIWALGQIGRTDESALHPLVALLKDADAEIRAQTAKVLGDGRLKAAADALAGRLKDDSPRVRFFAAVALGKVTGTASLSRLVDMLRDNADSDPFVRHAAVMGLAGTQTPDALLKVADDPSVSVRLGVLLALRRLERAEISRFLNDSDPLVVIEAARAIHDLPIVAALPQLAAMIESIPASALAILKGQEETGRGLLSRILNANFRVGEPRNGEMLAALIQRSDVAVEYRLEALRELTDWAEPHGRDRVLNLWRPLAPRDASAVTNAVKPFLQELLKSATVDLQVAACQFAGKHKITDVAPILHALSCDENQVSGTRVAAFGALAEQRYGNMIEVVRSALASKHTKLRQDALQYLASLNPADAVPFLAEALNTAPFAEKQTAISLLAKMNRADGDAILVNWLDKLLAGTVPTEIQLDLLDVAQGSANPALKQRFEQYKAKLPADDEITPFKPSLAGGDAVLGRKVFVENEKVQCSRCHKIGSRGGDVGPDLSKIAQKRDRAYLLESIIQPNNHIAEGYEVNMAVLNDGRVIIGIVKADDEKRLCLQAADGKLTEIPKDEIKTRRRRKESAMPPMGEVLSKSEIRNVIEYLSTLK
jgi:quinoprotein glucose dehydrogenase